MGQRQQTENGNHKTKISEALLSISKLPSNQTSIQGGLSKINNESKNPILSA